MPNFMLLSRCENVWPFLTIRALTTCSNENVRVFLQQLQRQNTQGRRERRVVLAPVTTTVGAAHGEDQADARAEGIVALRRGSGV